MSYIKFDEDDQSKDDQSKDDQPKSAQSKSEQPKANNIQLTEINSTEINPLTNPLNIISDSPQIKPADNNNANFLNILYLHEDNMSAKTSPDKLFVYKLKLQTFGNFYSYVKNINSVYQAIMYASADWLQTFRGLGVVVCVDRLILIGRSKFSGKTKKLETLISGYISVRFNHWFYESSLPQKYVDTAHFDCRLMQPDDTNIRNLIHAAVYEYILQNKQLSQPQMTAIYNNRRCTVDRMLNGILYGF